MLPSNLRVDAIEDLGLDPDKRYVLLSIDRDGPPGCALTKRGEYDSLDEIIVPPPSSQMDYVVYDREGRTYSREEL